MKFGINLFGYDEQHSITIANCLSHCSIAMKRYHYHDQGNLPKENI